MAHPPTINRPTLDAILTEIALAPVPATRAATTRLASRIKKLLDLDRTLSTGPKRTPRAFTEHEGLRQGVDAAYTPFNAFCLALGLELLEAGFKQSEVVLWLRLVRPALETEHTRILGAARSKSHLKEPGKHERLYMTVERILQASDLPDLKAAGARGNERVAIAPKLHAGSEALALALARSPSTLRRWLVIEYHVLAVRLWNNFVDAAGG